MPAQEPDVYQQEDTWLDFLREMKRLGLLQQIEIDRANGERIPLWRLMWSAVDPNTPYDGEPYNNRLTGAGKAWAKAMKNAVATFFDVQLIRDGGRRSGTERKSLGLCIPAPPAPAAPPAPTTVTTTATATTTSGDKVRLSRASVPPPAATLLSTLHAATLTVL